MSNAIPDPQLIHGATQVVDVLDVQAHVAKVKAAWRQRERTMTWEQKVEAIERMRERDAQLTRARLRVNRPGGP